MNDGGQANGFTRLTAAIIPVLLVGAIGGMMMLWRDVAVLERRQDALRADSVVQHAINRDVVVEAERQKHIVATMERFKTAYDREESMTAELFKTHYQLIIDLQRQAQALADRLRQLERAQGLRGEEPR